MTDSNDAQTDPTDAPDAPAPPAPRAGAATARLGELLASAGVPASFTARTAARLGPDAAGRLRADPWRLLKVPGVQPRQADHFARRLLGEDARPDDPRRGRALALHVLTGAARDGHTVTPAADVVAALERIRAADPRRAVEDALNEGEALALTEEPSFDEAGFDEDEDAEPPEPEETLGLARWALAEEAAAEGFQRLTFTAAPLLDDAAVKELRAGLSEDRSLALTAALRTGVSVLRGAPGDVERTAVHIAEAAAGAGLRAAVVAPTERAAAVLAAQVSAAGRGGDGDGAPDASATDASAADASAADASATDEGAADRGTAGADAGVVVTSLHRLLEPQDDPSAAPGTIVFGRGEQRPFELDLVVLPDAAGLDVELCAVLVEACADGTHLMLGGEPGALPPAGPGRPLGDLEDSETVPVIELDAAPSGGPLGTLTAAVRAGDLVAVEAPGKEVVIVPAASAGEAVHRAVQLVTDSIPRALGVPLEEIQVVAPAAGGEAGATALNAALKARLNPGPGAYGGLDPGDRVVVAAPLRQAAAGEIGVVTGAGPDGLEIEFAGGPVTVAASDASGLRHGWAVPVWLGRGTRPAAVVAVMSEDGAGAALSRPAVSAAFGMARRHLSVVQAAGPALARAVRETGAPARRTRLARLVVP
ncbi:helix-hairpin-helix domain-containing protein [Spirillospora sp. NBC_01491]|uniref:helix-hairpin-helix domain-containing protein n=1 Tax=Spirillospora sp. NBC_01491 TaxID=2976007 RepID=UPI002E2EB0FF|nr:helix-hairpin-helix domain-containing protein [Spirillospora sp. NBC_01491]